VTTSLLQAAHGQHQSRPRDHPRCSRGRLPPGRDQHGAQHPLCEETQREDGEGGLGAQERRSVAIATSSVMLLSTKFSGNHMADVSRNGELRDPAKLLEATARSKVRPAAGCLRRLPALCHGQLRADPRRVFAAPLHQAREVAPRWGRKWNQSGSA
jgi:hypothetical protein